MLRRHVIGHHKSSPSKPRANGAVEVGDKTLKKILTKMTKTYKDWVDKLPYTLWGYRTSVRMTTRLYSLVYGMEAVLLVEIEMKSMRVMMEAELAE